MDAVALYELKRLSFVPTFYNPTQFLVDIFTPNGIPITFQKLSYCVTLQKSVLVGLLILTPHIYRSTLKIAPWAVSHYLYAKGGYFDSSKEVQRIWEDFWERFAKSDFLRFPTVSIDGPWPYVTYEVKD
jgi:hypothetical protein